MSENNGTKKRKTNRRTSIAATIALTQWMTERKTNGERIALSEAMAFASGKGYTLSESGVRGVAKLLGIALEMRRRPRTQKRGMKYYRAIAYSIRALYEKLGEPVPRLLMMVSRGERIDDCTVADAYAPNQNPADGDRKIFDE